MTGAKLNSSTDIYQGQLFAFIGEDPVAFASSASLEVSVEEIDISNKMMGAWAGALAGKRSYSISSESFITRVKGAMSYDTLLEKMIAGDPIDFFFGEAASTDKDNFGGTFTPDKAKINYTGKVLITSLTITSEAGQIAKCSASFKGVGALVPVAGTAPAPANAGE